MDKQTIIETFKEWANEVIDDIFYSEYLEERSIEWFHSFLSDYIYKNVGEEYEVELYQKYAKYFIEIYKCSRNTKTVDNIRYNPVIGVAIAKEDLSSILYLDNRAFIDEVFTEKEIENYCQEYLGMTMEEFFNTYSDEPDMFITLAGDIIRLNKSWFDSYIKLNDEVLKLLKEG